MYDLEQLPADPAESSSVQLAAGVDASHGEVQRARHLPEVRDRGGDLAAGGRRRPRPLADLLP